MKTGINPEAIRKIKKVIRIFLIVVFGITAALLIVVAAARGINYANHRVIGENSNDKGMYVTLGGMEQYVHFRTADTSNPVIVYLHGGPGSPDSFVTYLFADKFDEDYTFVCWDQRGAGRTYEHNKKTDPDNETVGFDRALADLDELVDFVCDRYDQDKVIIMGHSYGTMLGSRYVLAHPEKVSHYIGIGQMVYFPDGEDRSYEDALAQAKAAGDDTSDMEKAWAEYAKDPNNFSAMFSVRNFTSKYHKAPKESGQIWMGMSSPYMNLADMRYFFRLGDTDGFIKLQQGLLGSLDVDMNRFTEYEVPVDIIMGEYDWTCPVVCAEKYCDKINAPSKGFHIIEGCGHSPQYDDVDAFAQTVREILK